MLTTLAKTKDLLGIASGVTTHDAILTRFLTSVGQTAKRKLDRELEYASYTETLNGSGREHLRLPQYPIVAVTDVRIDSDQQFPASTALDTDDLIIRSESGLLCRKPGTLWLSSLHDTTWPKGVGNVRVTWTAGYWVTASVAGADEMPADIQEAAMLAAAVMFKRHRQLVGGQNPELVAAESFAGATTVNYRDEWDADWGMPKFSSAIFRAYRGVA